MSRANQWFVPGEGIAREVITADIQRYLGPDALVRPGSGTGEFEGRPGYWITAYRTLTSQMIQDLKMDSQRWQQERVPGEAGRGVAYQDSQTHAARQHWGPTEGYRAGAASQSRPSYSSQQYAGGSEHYTTTPTPAYGSSTHQAYQVPQASHAAPRTQPADPYSYQQPGARDHPSYATPSSYPYPQQSTQDSYGRQPAPPPTHAGYSTTPSTAAAPGYYIASDGRQYPLPAQQQQGRRRNP